MGKKSEYGRNFKVNVLQTNIPAYLENFEYRCQRKEREFAHTPLSWRREWKEDSENGGSDDNVNKSPPQTPNIIEEEEEDEESDVDGDIMEDKRTGVEDNVNELSVTDTGTDRVEKLDYNAELLKKMAEKKLNKYINEDNIETPKKTKSHKHKSHVITPPPKALREKSKPNYSTVVLSNKTRPKPTKKCNTHFKPRPSSAPPKRSVKQEVSVPRPPFAMYGGQNSTGRIGCQKTFNVRASTDVSAASLSALKRREAELEKQKSKEKRPISQEKIQTALFNDKLWKETSSWSTEYRNHFIQYGDSLYERNSRSARVVKRPIAFFA